MRYVPANLRAAPIALSSLMAMQRTGPFRWRAIDTAPGLGEEVPRDDAREVMPARWTRDTLLDLTFEGASLVRSSGGSVTSTCDEVAPSGRLSARLSGS